MPEKKHGQQLVKERFPCPKWYGIEKHKIDQCKKVSLCNLNNSRIKRYTVAATWSRYVNLTVKNHLSSHRQFCILCRIRKWPSSMLTIAFQNKKSIYLILFTNNSFIGRIWRKEEVKQFNIECRVYWVILIFTIPLNYHQF